MGRIRRRIRKAVDKGIDRAKNAADKVADKAKDVAKKVDNKVIDRVEDRFEKAIDRVKDRVDDVKDLKKLRPKQLARHLRLNKIKKAFGHLADAAGKLADKLEDVASKVADIAAIGLCLVPGAMLICAIAGVPRKKGLRGFRQRLQRVRKTLKKIGKTIKDKVLPIVAKVMEHTALVLSFVPGAGQLAAMAASAVAMACYAAMGDWKNAAMMALGLIPGGAMAAKGIRGARAAANVAKSAKAASKGAKAASKGAKAASKAKKASKAAKAGSRAADRAIDGMDAAMMTAGDVGAKALSKAADKGLRVLTRHADNFAATGKRGSKAVKGVSNTLKKHHDIIVEGVETSSAATAGLVGGDRINASVFDKSLQTAGVEGDTANWMSAGAGGASVFRGGPGTPPDHNGSTNRNQKPMDTGTYDETDQVGVQHRGRGIPTEETSSPGAPGAPRPNKVQVTGLGLDLRDVETWPDMTVRDLKILLGIELDDQYPNREIQPVDLRLRINGETLDDDLTLRSYLIGDGAEIEVDLCGPDHSKKKDETDVEEATSTESVARKRASSKEIQVFVRGLDGRSKPTLIETDVPIGEVKARLAKEAGVDVDEVHLASGGKPLEDQATLADYNITAKQTIELNFRLRGGGKTNDAPDTGSMKKPAASEDDPNAVSPEIEARRKLTLGEFMAGETKDGRKLDPELAGVRRAFAETGVLWAWSVKTSGDRRSGPAPQPDPYQSSLTPLPELRDVPLEQIIIGHAVDTRYVEFKKPEALKKFKDDFASYDDPDNQEKKRRAINPHGRGEAKKDKEANAAARKFKELLGIEGHGGGDGFHKLVVADTTVDGRPNFTRATQRAIWTRPGQHRRHVVAWHTMRGFTRKVVQDPVMKAAMVESVKEHVETVRKRMQKRQQEFGLDDTHTRDQTLNTLRDGHAQLRKTGAPPNSAQATEWAHRMEEIALADALYHLKVRDQGPADPNAKNMTKPNNEKEMYTDYIDKFSTGPDAATKWTDDDVMTMGLYLMNSNPGNLWAGDGWANSTLNSTHTNMKEPLAKATSLADLKGVAILWKRLATGQDGKQTSSIYRNSATLGARVLKRQLRYAKLAVEANGDEKALAKILTRESKSAMEKGTPDPDLEKNVRKYFGKDEATIVSIIKTDMDKVILSNLDIDVLTNSRSDDGMSEAEPSTWSQPYQDDVKRMNEWNANLFGLRKDSIQYLKDVDDGAALDPHKVKATVGDFLSYDVSTPGKRPAVAPPPTEPSPPKKQKAVHA